VIDKLEVVTGDGDGNITLFVPLDCLTVFVLWIVSRYLSSAFCLLPFVLIVATESNQPIDPTEGVMPKDEAIDVTSEPTTDTTEAEATDTTPDTTPDAKPAYHSLNWRAFLRYAKSKGINTRNKTRAEIELELLTQAKQ